MAGLAGSLVPRLVLAVVVAAVAAGLPCPASCSCTWRGGREVMECSNLTFLPSVPHPAADRVGVQEMVVGGGSRVASLIRHQLYDSSLTSLRRLHMAACQLQIIDEGAFYSMERLQHLNLSHNLLSGLGSGQLAGLPLLHTLDLSHNRLAKLGPGFLADSRRLVALHLQGNLLATLPEGFLPPGAQPALALAGNPWRCDCRLLHLPAPPDSCPGRLDCPARLTSLVTEGGVLRCRASGWPRPRLSWSRDQQALPADLVQEQEEHTMPRVVTSSLATLGPGVYRCQTGEETSSLTVAEEVAPASMGVVVGVAAATAVVVLLLLLLCVFVVRARTKVEEGHASSLAGLQYYGTNPTTANPLPKPPRTFSSMSTLLPPEEATFTSLERGTSFPPAPTFSNTPRCRASLGALSLHSAPPDGLVTPRRPVPPPTYLSLPRPAPPLANTSATAATLCRNYSPRAAPSPINTCGLPATNPLHTIQELE